MNKLWLMIIAGALSFAMAAFASDRELHVTYVHRKSTQWTGRQIANLTEELNEVYRQCGITVTSSTTRIQPDSQFPAAIEKFDPNSSASPEQMAEAQSMAPRPLIFLVEAISPVDQSTPFSREQFTELRRIVPLSLRGTVWMPFAVNSDAYREARKSSPYSVIAHELAHVLSLDGGHNNDPQQNLFTIYRRRNNHLTSEQCAMMRASPYLR